MNFAHAYETGAALPKRLAPPRMEPDLFSVPAPAAPGVPEKLAGMATADAHATDRWSQLALDCVRLCADALPDFTSDDVWKSLVASGQDVIETERNPKALGAVMLRAARAGLIVKTGTVRNSTHVANHARPVQVWQKAPTLPVIR